MVLFFIGSFVLCVILTVAIINEHKEVVMNLRDQKEAEAATVYFTHDPKSWTLADQCKYQDLCRDTGWSELRSADEARDFRDFVEGNDQPS
jgi:hypothetical protein